MFFAVFASFAAKHIIQLPNLGLVFGDDIVLEGENLFVLGDADVEVSDNIVVAYCTQNSIKPFYSTSSGFVPGTVSNDGRRMVISWEKTIGGVLDINRKRPDADPEKNPPEYVAVALRSRSGVPTAKMQLHRARAFFDTWIQKFPDSSFSNRPWITM